MKKIAIYNKIFISLILSLLLFSSCDKDPSLSIGPKEITAEAVGGVFSVTVNSNGEWTAAVENADINNWCSLENSSGKENGEIKIKISENPDSLPREAIIKVSLENLTQEIKISQNGFISEVIPFSEYTLVESSCEWQNLNYNDLSSLIVINSEEELTNYISCTSETYAVIDFSKSTLLIACGTMPGGLYDIETTIYHYYTSYELNIKLLQNETTVACTCWEIGLIIPKVEENSTFNINTSVIEPNNIFH